MESLHSTRLECLSPHSFGFSERLDDFLILLCTQKTSSSHNISYHFIVFLLKKGVHDKIYIEHDLSNCITYVVVWRVGLPAPIKILQVINWKLILISAKIIFIDRRIFATSNRVSKLLRRNF